MAKKANKTDAITTGMLKKLERTPQKYTKATYKKRNISRSSKIAKLAVAIVGLIIVTPIIIWTLQPWFTWIMLCSSGNSC